MKLIATLVDTTKKTIKVLQEVPEGSVVLFPESVSPNGPTVKKYSIKRGLFIIYNSDTKENGRFYISMRGVDEGEELWRVRKYNLWGSDHDRFSPAPKPEPIVSIRGKTASIYICYDLCKVAGFGRLFKLGEQLKEEKPEIIMFPANWSFRWIIPEGTLESVMDNIDTLKAGLFSCTRKYALAFTRYEKKKITSGNWIEIDID